MAATDTNSTWERIRQGVKEAETLIGQKKYNLSMVKSKQTLEFMVQILCEKAAIVETDLTASIDELYSSRVISKTTCEHYHKIRMLGDKAVQEGSENAYDANQAYHLLSQEVYTFANDYSIRRRRPAPSKSQSRPQNRAQSSSQSSSQSGQPVRRSSSGGSSSSGSNKSRKRAKQRGFALSQADLLHLGAVLIIIILLVVFIRACGSKKEEVVETTPITTTEAIQPPSTEAAPVRAETMAETTPAPVYKTSTNLNVRSLPSTDGQKLGLLPADTIVEYIGAHNDEWAIISYEGVEAYVASQYLVHD